MGIIVGIDASRNRSGGAKAHLIGILSEENPLKYGISQVHVWSYRELMDSIPNKEWIVKHVPPVLERNLFWQLMWQRFVFPKLARQAGCDIVLNTDAGTVARFIPSVTMSRDALSYEPGELQRYGFFSKARLRLILLRFVQNRSLIFSTGSTFLTEYIAKLIQLQTGRLQRYKVIPHGISNEFRKIARGKWPQPDEAIKLLYVSNVELYKHQWRLVKAVSVLVGRGYNLRLTLAGGNECRKSQALLDDALNVCDPRREYVTQLGHVPRASLPALIGDSDLFVFASSCETISNTLLEGMASGRPIACSNRGPMPEVLKDGGEYFDPEDENSIADAIEKIITDEDFRETISVRAEELSQQYRWTRCADETWRFMVSTLNWFISQNNAITWHDRLATIWGDKYEQRGEFKERFVVFCELIRKYSMNGCSVFDLGCGTGIFSFFSFNCNCNVYGVDASVRMISECNKSKYQYYNDNDAIKFIQSDVSRLSDVLDVKADIVIASSLFEYMENLKETLSLIASRLNNGGVVIFSLPNRCGLYRRIEAVFFQIFRRPRYFQYVKNSMSLMEAIILSEECGFDVVETRYFTKTPYLPKFIGDMLLNELFVVVARKL